MPKNLAEKLARLQNPDYVAPFGLRLRGFRNRYRIAIGEISQITGYSVNHIRGIEVGNDSYSPRCAILLSGFYGETPKTVLQLPNDLIYQWLTTPDSTETKPNPINQTNISQELLIETRGLLGKYRSRQLPYGKINPRYVFM